MTYNKEFLSVPDNIHPLFYDGGAAFLNSETGQYGSIDRGTATLLKIINATGQLGGVHDFFTAKYPHLSADEVAILTDECLKPAFSNGVLELGPKKEPREFRTAEHYGPNGAPIAVDPKAPNLSTNEKITAAIAIASTHRLMKLPFTVKEQKIRQARAKTSRPATHEEAQRAGSAVSHMSRLYLGRFACLEMSIATVLFGARRGFSIDMQLAAGFYPLRFHVWAEAEGKPVHTIAEQQLHQSGLKFPYTPFYKI